MWSILLWFNMARGMCETWRAANICDECLMWLNFVLTHEQSLCNTVSYETAFESVCNMCFKDLPYWSRGKPWSFCGPHHQWPWLTAGVTSSNHGLPGLLALRLTPSGMNLGIGCWDDNRLLATSALTTRPVAQIICLAATPRCQWPTKQQRKDEPEWYDRSSF